MTINTELFQKVYDQITKHPETHDQSIFEGGCGTTRCVAGWAVVIHHGIDSIYQLHYRGGSFIAREAAELLGLSEEEADHLFYKTVNYEAVELCRQYASG